MKQEHSQNFDIFQFKQKANSKGSVFKPNIYRPKTKLLEGKFVTAVCLSTRGLPSHNVMGHADPPPPPWRQTPLRRPTDGQYASWWNAYLFYYELFYVMKWYLTLHVLS